jgi:catechol 2,3-dioxygenase-like lactoylglutathione lyase family enzyme
VSPGHFHHRKHLIIRLNPDAERSHGLRGIRVPEEAHMKLNHLDLQVADVARAVTFFEEAFGFQLHSNRRSSAIAFLDDGEGFVLVLQRKKADTDHYPDGFHFGFLVDDVESVHSFYATARALGLETSDIIENGRGTQVYCSGPDGLLAEVSFRPRN